MNFIFFLSFALAAILSFSSTTKAEFVPPGTSHISVSGDELRPIIDGNNVTFYRKVGGFDEVAFVISASGDNRIDIRGHTNLKSLYINEKLIFDQHGKYFGLPLTASDLAPNSVGNSELADDAVGSENVIDNSLTALDLAADSVGNSELADDAVGSENVIENSLTASDLAADSVGSSELANNSVGSENVINNSLTASDLAEDSVGNSELADNAAGSENVIDNSLTASDLAEDSVGNSELANDAVGSENVIENSLTALDLAADSVGNSELADDAVGSLNVVDNSLTAADLAADSVGNSELADNAVGGDNVINNSITPNKLAQGLFAYNETIDRFTSDGRCRSAFSNNIVIAEGVCPTGYRVFSGSCRETVLTGNLYFQGGYIASSNTYRCTYILKTGDGACNALLSGGYFPVQTHCTKAITESL